MKHLNDVEITQPVKTVSTNYTITEEDRNILCNATNASFVVTLPVSSNNNKGLEYTVKVISNSVNVVAIITQSSQLIDLSTTVTLSALTQVKLLSTGSGWVATSSITVNSSTPPAGVGGATWFNSTLGMLMYYDSVREKWLSIIPTTEIYGHDGTNIGANTYLRTSQNISSDVNGLAITQPITITGVRYTTSTVQSGSIAIRTRLFSNGSLSGNLITVSKTNSRFYQDISLNYDIDTNRHLAVIVAASNHNRPLVAVTYQYRYEAP